jgi:uncharacterized membrane protein YjgN (DUF898 family)
MTEQEALQILGLQPGASAESIVRAYQNLIVTQRPDEAGGKYFALAKDTLLRQAQPAGGGAAEPLRHSTVPSIPERVTAGAAYYSPTPRARGAVHFLGLEKAYWRIMIRGSALLAVTLGIYRFWLTTDMRRFLWSNTEVAGETLEYAGTARELLLGFLIAMAILIPIYALLFIAALNMGTIGQITAPLSFVVLTVLGHYAVYRARRYRLTRTVYRGVRFHQTGSAWRYAACAVFWWVMIALTLGLAYPVAQASLERYKMKNTYLGNMVGRFEGSGWRLFLRGFLMWFLVVGPPVAGIVAIVATAASVDTTIIDDIMSGGGEDAIKRLANENPGFAAAAIGFSGALFWSFTAALLLYPVFQALLLRWWLSGLRFGDVTVTSHVRTGKVYGAYLRFIGWSMVLGMASSIVIAICVLLIGLLVGSESKETAEIIGAIVGVTGYVVIMLGYSALYQVKVKLGLWRIVVESIDLTNVAALESVSAVGAPASPVGEGLADALNVGGF